VDETAHFGFPRNAQNFHSCPTILVIVQVLNAGTRDNKTSFAKATKSAFTNEVFFGYSLLYSTFVELLSLNYKTKEHIFGSIVNSRLN
jgi:hypothetical protein